MRWVLAVFFDDFADHGVVNARQFAALDADRLIDFPALGSPVPVLRHMGAGALTVGDPRL